MAKPIRRSLVRRLGRNIGDRRRAVGLTQEQLAEYLEIDSLTVSRYETGNILPPLTVVDVVAPLLNTTIVDFTFNLGAGRLQTSTLRRRINQRDWVAARQELRRWVYGGGKVLPGLVARREAECALLGVS